MILIERRLTSQDDLTRSRFVVGWRTILLSLAFVLGAAPLFADQRRDCSQPIDMDLAIRACTKIIESGAAGKQLTEAYKERSDAYYSSGNYERAIADLNIAIEQAPRDVELYVKRGLAFRRTGDYARAVADFDTAIKLKPGRASLYTMRGGAYQMQGNRTAAIADFEKALKIDPSLQSLRAALDRLRGRPNTPR